jgi:uncharacterized membrane protein (DUF106 family)
MTGNDDAVRLLAEIRDNQKLQIERQLEALALQREQFAIFQRQVERNEKLQDRAEQLQGSGAALVAGARKVMLVIVPFALLLLAYLTWLVFR